MHIVYDVYTDLASIHPIYNPCSLKARCTKLLLFFFSCAPQAGLLASPAASPASTKRSSATVPPTATTEVTKQVPTLDVRPRQ